MSGQKFHINPKGDVSQCRAKENNCPFEFEHYSSPEEARKEFELRNEREAWLENTFTKNNWLRMDWEARKNIIEDYTQDLARKHGIIPPPPSVTIIWEELPKKAGHSEYNMAILAKNKEKNHL